MAAKEVKRPNISLSHQTKNRLDMIKHRGQSYDGLIQDLINSWREKKGGSEGERKKRLQP